MQKSVYLIILFLLFFSNAFCKNMNEKKIENHIFIHVCTINHWDLVLSRQLKRMKKSGLYKHCDSISLSVLGTGDLSPFIEKYPKIKIMLQDHNTSLYERVTILKLHELCSYKKNINVLYFHTKGVTRPGNQNVEDWTKLMEYFLIDQWRDCVEALKEYDACGVNYHFDYIPPFFVGNFWWATSKYISKLPGYIGPQYMDPELWIGTGHPNAKSFHQADIPDMNHYAFPYPESKYVKKNE